MKLIPAAIIVSSALVSGPAQAQKEPEGNPFPDVIARSEAIRPFVLDGSQVKLSGVIIQAPVHIKPENPYQYFRMSVSREGTSEIWAVLIYGPDSDFVDLKPGVKVTLLATPSKDGSRRVQLIQMPKRQGSAGEMSLIIDSK